ncbi:MAG TPA: hypothetical protein VN380_15210 [Thermoanaerobaculia bacterium]|nr:hypothetical protein [Thermoanaerobaculia bacterium]
MIPDITSPVNVMTPRGPTCVEAHLAYISVPDTDEVTCVGCEKRVNEKDEKMLVLYLKGDNVHITGLTEPFNEKGYSASIPHIDQYCPNFRLSVPETATIVPLKNGKLSTRCDDGKCADGHARDSVLAHGHVESVTIEARHGNVLRSMVIRPKGPFEITISNRYAVGHFQNKLEFPALAENHWLAFYTLSATPVICDLPVTKGGILETTLACSNSGYP